MLVLHARSTPGHVTRMTKGQDNTSDTDKKGRRMEITYSTPYQAKY